MAVRITLGALGVLALRSFRVAIGKKFGKEVEMVFTVITCSQFHFIFYLSRTLPNIFALCLGKGAHNLLQLDSQHLMHHVSSVLIGFRFWLQEEWQKTIAIFAFAASVFRSNPAELPAMLSRSKAKKLSM